MENQNILVTGYRGYLGSRLTKHLYHQYNIIPYTTDVREYRPFSDIDIILHFASPSDSFEFRDKQKTSSTIVDGTINLLRVAKHNNAKFIFASTMGVYEHTINDVYCTCKLAMENYITCNYNNYIILRIPRVYSRCRQKGLMRKIKKGTIPEGDMDKQVEYITLDDFVSQTLPVLNQSNIVHEYDITCQSSIREIKRWIEE